MAILTSCPVSVPSLLFLLSCCIFVVADEEGLALAGGMVDVRSNKKKGEILF